MDRVELPVVTEWFVREHIDDSVTLLTEPHVHPLLRCNVWHVRGRDQDLLVDTGLGLVSLRSAAADLFDADLIAVATHTHTDHVGSLHEFESRAVHEAEAEAARNIAGVLHLDVSGASDEGLEQMRTWGYDIREGLLTAVPRVGFDLDGTPRTPAPPTRVLSEGDVIDLGDRAFEVLHLPGHSPGSIGLWDESSGVLFSVVGPSEGRRRNPRVFGWLLLSAPVLLMPIGGMLLMGDAFPTRAGVTSIDGQLHALTIGCPRERLRDVSLYRLGSNDGSLPATLIWHATGDVALSETLTLGVSPEGMTETVAMRSQPTPTDRLSLRVDTDRVDTSSLMFVVAEVPGDGVLGEYGLFPSADQLRADEEARSSVCDPYGDRIKNRIMIGYLGVTGALSVVGLITLIATRKPRHAS